MLAIQSTPPPPPPASAHALPLYVQVSEMLIREIAAGRLLEGEKLPPEREMARGLGIAVGTLRRALADLAEKGLIERRQGSGNYVRAPAGAVGVYAFFRLELVRGGGLPTARLLSVTRAPAPAPGELPSFGGDLGWRIRRLRYLGDTPAALEEIWFDAARAPELDPAELSESLYLFYRDRLGLTVARAEDRVGVGAVPDWAPAQFPLAPGAVCGEVVRASDDAAGRRAEASRTWFDPATTRYVSRLK